VRWRVCRVVCAVVRCEADGEPQRVLVGTGLLEQQRGRDRGGGVGQPQRALEGADLLHRHVRPVGQNQLVLTDHVLDCGTIVAFLKIKIVNQRNKIVKTIYKKEGEYLCECRRYATVRAGPATIQHQRGAA